MAQTHTPTRHRLGTNGLELLTFGLLFAFYLAAFHPGALTADPIFMMMQVRGVFPVNDWHPPAITALWALLDAAVRTDPPGALYVVQTLLLVHAVHGVTRTLSDRPPLRCLLGAAILLWPAVLGNFGVLWKDNWFAIFLLYAYGFAARFERHGRLTTFALSATFGMLAALTRFNGLLAALPLLAYACAVLVRRQRPGLPARAVALRCTALVAALLGVVGVASWGLARFYVERPYASWQVIPFYDLAGISVHSGRLYVPDYIRRGEAPEPAPSVEQLREGYRSHTADYLVWGPLEQYRWPVPNEIRELEQTPAQRRDILEAWLRAVAAEPAAYLKHRGGMMAAHLGLFRAEVCAPFQLGIIPNRFGWTSEPGPVRTWVEQRLLRMSRWLPFRGWFYVVATLLLSVLWWRGARSNSGLALLSSSLLVLASNAVLLAACDFRYMLWPVVAALVAGLGMLVPGRAAPTPSGGRAQLRPPPGSSLS